VSRAREIAFEGTLTRRSELLIAPASGAACVHWRLKIIEPLDARLQFVHELESPEHFDLCWVPPRAANQIEHGDKDAGRATALSVLPDESGRVSDLPSRLSSDLHWAATAAHADSVRLRISPESMRLTVRPVLHRAGSPGALRVAQQFGLSDSVAVEEIALLEGERVGASGLLEATDNDVAGGPFRDVSGDLELHESVLTLPQRRELGAAILPWALGTAAVILGGVGATAWTAWRFDLLSVFPSPPAHFRAVAEIGPIRQIRRHFSLPE